MKSYEQKSYYEKLLAERGLKLGIMEQELRKAIKSEVKASSSNSNAYNRRLLEADERAIAEEFA